VPDELQAEQVLHSFATIEEAVTLLIMAQWDPPVSRATCEVLACGLRLSASGAKFTGSSHAEACVEQASHLDAGVNQTVTQLSGKRALRKKLTRAELGKMARRLHKTNTTKLFGFQLQAAGGGRAAIGMKVRSHHIQLHNVVHGGILCALADTTGAIAAYTALPPGTHLATIELKINFLEPVAGGRIVAQARVLRRGRNFVVSDCDIFNPGKVLVAKALMTFAIGSAAPQS
jgi:uncharacterized protein (TIGR00369 family)